jgi:hypothetical protein
MIRLKDLLSIENVEKDTDAHEKGSVWVVTHSGHFGAKNSFDDVRYFVDRDKAVAFTQSHTHHPHDLQHSEKKDPIDYTQKYDIRES